MMIETLSGTILLRNFHLTLSTRQNKILPLFLILYFSEGREQIAEDAPAPAEDVPAPAPAPAEDVPAPAPAPTLETVEERQPYIPGSRKSMRKNFGKPASAYSDSYMQTLSRPGLVDDQYKLNF